jgi:hypothetical protein
MVGATDAVDTESAMAAGAVAMAIAAPPASNAAVMYFSPFRMM